MSGPDQPTLINPTPPAEPPDDPGFITRHAIMPPSNAWGGTPTEQAHLQATCNPNTCPHCNTDST